MGTPVRTVPGSVVGGVVRSSVFVLCSEFAGTRENRKWRGSQTLRHGCVRQLNVLLALNEITH